jgi:hypothetical protein
LVVILVVAIPCARAADHIVADFEGKNPLKRWTFSNGPEFPGAFGSLSIGPGHQGQGAILGYRFYCDQGGECGRYVAAEWKPDAHLDSKRIVAVSLWVKCPPEVAIRLRVKDKKGQTLQYNAETTTLEHRSSDEWRHIVVPFDVDSSTGHWGGDENGALRGKVVEVGILAEARYRYPVEGEVALDDIALLEAGETKYRLDPAAPVEPAPKVTALFGVNDHMLRDERSLDIARDVGFKLVRLDLRWSGLERNGEFRFERMDRTMDVLEARGLETLAIFDYGHPDHGGDVPRKPEDIAAFARYAKEAAAHFKGRKIRYEIWNEPNIDRFWKPRPSALEYASLLRAAVAAIHEADPGALVCTGGISNIDLPFLIPLLRSGAAREVNAIGVHPYRAGPPESFAADWTMLRKLIGTRPDIWITEWGYSSAQRDKPDGHSEAARRRQAILAVREALTAWALGVPLSIWYDLRDDGRDANNPEDNFGLFDTDGQEKPAMVAIRTLFRIAGDRSYTGMIRDVPDGTHAMRLEGAAETRVIAWSEKDSVSIEIPTENLVSAFDAFGSPVALKSSIQLNEASGPVYLIWKR